MSSDKHTPAWYAAQADNTTDSWEVYEGDTIIAEGMTEINAKLLSAAPELLLCEELKELFDSAPPMCVLKDKFYDAGWDEEQGNMLLWLANKRRSAIAKSQGGS